MCTYTFDEMGVSKIQDAGDRGKASQFVPQLLGTAASAATCCCRAGGTACSWNWKEKIDG